MGLFFKVKALQLTIKRFMRNPGKKIRVLNEIAYEKVKFDSR